VPLRGVKVAACGRPPFLAASRAVDCSHSTRPYAAIDAPASAVKKIAHGHACLAGQDASSPPPHHRVQRPHAAHF
jgi:hypothetical protein